jgi:hypothetical protein
MATLDQLQTALVNADKAGDVEAATALATEIRRMKPAAMEAGEAINSIPRQLGLTARYGVEGLANMAQIGTEPLRYLTDRLTGQTGKTLPLGELASRGLDAIGSLVTLRGSWPGLAGWALPLVLQAPCPVRRGVLARSCRPTCRSSFRLPLVRVLPAAHHARRAARP